MEILLVDPKFYQQTIVEKLLNGLDQHISSILNTDLPDDVKVKQYAEAVRRFSIIKEAEVNDTTAAAATSNETDVLDSILVSRRRRSCLQE